jgi:hypothetical protein
MPPENTRCACAAQDAQQNKPNRAITSFKDRDAFSRAVLADVKLSHTARALIVRLALHLNIERQDCTVSYDTLGKEVGVSERTAIRLLAGAEARGWLVIERTCGRGRCNNFRLLLPSEKVTSGCHPNEAEKVTLECHPKQPEKVTTQDGKGDNPRHKKVTSGVTHLSEDLSEEKSGKKESRPPDLFAAGEGSKDAPKEGKGTTATQVRTRERSRLMSDGVQLDQEGPGKAADANGADDAAAEFEQFWRAYPRRVAKDAARKAFAKVRERGVALDVLVAGAKRYAAERAGQDPKYTKHPATWLNAGCWQDEAPAGEGGPPTIDGVTGEVVELRQMSATDRKRAEVKARVLARWAGREAAFERGA